MREFKNLLQINREKIVKIFSSGTQNELCEALVPMAFYDGDWKRSQDRCLHFLNHADREIRGAAASCLGHIARIHQQLDAKLMKNILKKHRNDPAVSGPGQDALDDMGIFLLESAGDCPQK